MWQQQPLALQGSCDGTCHSRATCALSVLPAVCLCDCFSALCVRVHCLRVVCCVLWCALRRAIALLCRKETSGGQATCRWKHMCVLWAACVFCGRWSRLVFLFLFHSFIFFRSSFNILLCFALFRFAFCLGCEAAACAVAVVVPISMIMMIVAAAADALVLMSVVCLCVASAAALCSTCPHSGTAGFSFCLPCPLSVVASSVFLPLLLLALFFVCFVSVCLCVCVIVCVRSRAYEQQWAVMMATDLYWLTHP